MCDRCKSCDGLFAAPFRRESISSEICVPSPQNSEACARSFGRDTQARCKLRLHVTSDLHLWHIILRSHLHSTSAVRTPSTDLNFRNTSIHTTDSSRRESRLSTHKRLRAFDVRPTINSKYQTRSISRTCLILRLSNVT